MGSIPLPALHVNPPAPQQDPMESYSRMLALRQMMQTAPLRQQEMQQQVQSGALDLQAKQRQESDIKAATTAMQGWDGNDYKSIIPAMIKNGASAQAVMGMKQKILEQQQSVSTMVKNNGEGAAAQMNAVKTKGDLLDGALAPLIDPKQVPDQQLPQAVMSTAQDLVQKGVLDPQHAQQAQQLAQSGDPNKIRQALDLMRKTNMAQSQITEEALKKAQTNEADVNAQLGPAKLAQTQANDAIQRRQEQQRLGIESSRLGIEGGRLNLERQKTNQASGSATAAGPIDWGKTAQRYGMTPQAFDQSAEKFATTGQLPPIGRNANAIAMNRDLMNRAAELHPSANLALNSADFKASQDSLKKVQGTYDMTHAFEQTAEKNMNLLQQTAQNIPELGSKFLNIPARAISSSMIGTENMARFKTALQTAQTEAAKVLNNPNSSGVLSDSARKELQGIIDGNMPVKAMVASLDTLKQDMSNRNTSYQDQINTIQDRIKAGGGGNSSTGNSSANKPPTGATHIVPGPDGKRHYTNAAGTVDLGVAP